MSGPLKGKVAVVTGGSQGLGEGIARAFADAGAAGLVICSRSAEKGLLVADELTRGGCPTEWVYCDLTSDADCRGVIEAADTRFGRVDVLVNAAGDSSRGTLDETTVELWDRLIAINARAPFVLTQEAARLMRREGRGGAVVNVISMSAHGGQPYLMAYVASKGALAAMTKNNAHALRGDRIRVNGIMLGWMDTPNEHLVQMKRHSRPEDWLAAAEKDAPFGRLIKPADVAGLCVFLGSDAGQMMTGALIDFDQNVNGAHD